MYVASFNFLLILKILPETFIIPLKSCEARPLNIPNCDRSVSFTAGLAYIHIVAEIQKSKQNCKKYVFSAVKAGFIALLQTIKMCSKNRIVM